jgi:hypothetical protein
MEALGSKKDRRLIFCAAAAAIVGLQWLAFSSQVVQIDPETYAECAVELQWNADWRYGYVRLWHGAVLVKTPNLGRGSPEPPVDPEYEPDLELKQIMRRELEALPRKALLEFLLYLSCLGYACFAMGPLRRALQGTNPGRLRVVGSEVLVWMGLWYIIAMPLPVGVRHAALHQLPGCRSPELERAMVWTNPSTLQLDRHLHAPHDLRHL